VPGADSHFLINPFGLHYTEVTASNLVKIDIEGNVLDASSESRGFRRARRNSSRAARCAPRDAPKHGAGEDMLRALLRQADAIDGSHRDLCVVRGAREL